MKIPLKHIPWAFQRIIHIFYERRADRARKNLTPQEVFSEIYKHERWGAGKESKFYSGWGSHNEDIVAPYIKAVSSFLNSLPDSPDVVDLGCGDFNIGKQVRSLCRNYVACDVVPQLIQHNRVTFASLNVDFRCLDITSEPLPTGDVLFIRQVLQHLNNEQIQRVVNKLYQFKYLVLTEHLPSVEYFVPNLNKSAGDDVRAGRVNPSAVVLTEKPFSFSPKSSDILCEIQTKGGIIQTILYEIDKKP